MGIDKTESNRHSSYQHFGVVNLTVHFTLAAGLAEQLGDKVEIAVCAAVSRIGGNNKDFLIDGAMIRMDHCWHQLGRQPDATSGDEIEHALSIHLSNDLESDLTYSVDWEWL